MTGVADGPARAIPGPGRLVPLADLRALRRSPLEGLRHVAARYGDLVAYPIGTTRLYLVNDPDAIRHILQENYRAYSKATFQYQLLGLAAGQGLLTSDGDHWRRQRRLAQPAFHHRRLAALAEGMTAAALDLAERWRAPAAAGAILDVDAEMMRLTLEIVGRSLLGADLRGQADALVGATLTALDHIVARARNPLSPPAWLPTPANRRFRAALATLDAAAYAIIAERRQRPQGGHDLLALLLEAADAETGEGMSDAQLRDEIITFIIAGHETVASSLTWTWRLLAEHPPVVAALAAELTAVLGGRPPTFDDLPHLPLTRMVVEEALRLYPPAWIVTRRALAADSLGPYRLPAGALVVISPYLTHRHPAHWPEPDRFDPWRFSPERAAGRHRYAYLPFGAGPRICIGNSFALVESQLILATLAQHYRLTLPPGPPVVVDPLVTLRPRHGLPMRVEMGV